MVHSQSQKTFFDRQSMTFQQQYSQGANNLLSNGQLIKDDLGILTPIYDEYMSAKANLLLHDEN